MSGFSLSESIYYIILIVVVYMIITAWDALLDTIFRHFCPEKRNTILYRFAAAAFFTLIGILILYIMDERLISIFGIDPIM